MSRVDRHIKDILSGAPELIEAPGLTVGLAQGANAPQSGPIDAVALGQTASLAAAAHGAQQASEELAGIQTIEPDAFVGAAVDGEGATHTSSGWSLNPLHDIAHAADEVGLGADDWGAAGSQLKRAGGYLLRQLSRPLGEVQHYYRYVHDQWTRNGVVAGLSAMVPISELGGKVRGGPQPHDYGRSWDITTDGSTYRDIHGNVVNPGYDLANVIDHIAHGRDYMPRGWTRDENGVMQPTAQVRHVDPASGNPVTKPYAFDDATLLHDKLSDARVMSVAKGMGIEVDAAELPHIRAAVGKALYGVGRGLVDPDYYDTAVRNVLTLDGHMVAPGLSSHHEIPGTGAGPAEDLREALHQAGARVPKQRSALTDRFTLWDANRGEHPMFWHYAIHEAAGDPGVQAGASAYLRALTDIADEEAAQRAFIEADTAWMRDATTDDAEQFRTKMALYGQGADQFSQLRLRALEGLTHGANGTVHKDVLAAVAGERELPSIADLAAKDVDARPLAVKGREIDPIAHPGTVDRISQWGWRRMIHPTINSMSRAPIYTMLTAKEYKEFAPWLERGLIDPAEAHQIAQTRAASRMLPLIHNTKLRSQMSDLFQNLTPFYFAQEQAYKRYGRVILTDPVAFRKAVLAAHSISNSGILRADGNGNQSVVLPGAGPLGKWATIGAAAIGLPVMGGVPSVISGNTISLKSVVPEGNLPSVSPLVAVPLKEIQNYFPQSEPLIAKVIGSVNEAETATDQLIPNATLRRVLQATPLLDRETGFTTAYMNAVAYAAHRADDLRAQAASAQEKGNLGLAAKLNTQADRWLPGPNADPLVKQKALDRIKNSTRILTLVKAAIGALSPLSPSIDVGDVGLRDEVRADINRDGISVGLQHFLDRNPTATADTVFLSDSTYTGTSVPATKPALDWIEQNRGWIGSHALAAAYLVPQTKGAFDVEAYNQELASGLTQRRTPEQLVNALYAAATDKEYYASLTDFENQRAGLAGNTYAIGQLDRQWSAFKAQLAAANPVWAAQQNDPTKVEVARQTLYQLQQAIGDLSTPESSQLSIAKELSESYADYQQQQVSIRGGQIPGATLTDLKDQFNGYLDSVVEQDPAASALVTGVFRRLTEAG